MEGNGARGPWGEGGQISGRMRGRKESEIQVSLKFFSPSCYPAPRFGVEVGRIVPHQSTSIHSSCNPISTSETSPLTQLSQKHHRIMLWRLSPLTMTLFPQEVLKQEQADRRKFLEEYAEKNTNWK